jgi:chaperonin GroES
VTQEIKKVRFTPKGDNVLIRQAAAMEKTKGGIVLPEGSRGAFAANEGVVVALGPGKLSPEGKRLPMSVAVGDRVMYRQYANAAVKIDGVEYQVVTDMDLVGTFDPKDEADVTADNEPQAVPV